MQFLCGIGQDSHRFLSNETTKRCIIGGIAIENVPGMDADSDGDVVFHSICNAITSMTHVPILGKIAPHLCHEEGITDSKVYLDKALETLGDIQIHHVSLAIEGKRPRLQKWVDAIRLNVAHTMGLSVEQIGMTITSGDGLTDFARGEGIQCFCMIVALKQ